MRYTEEEIFEIKSNMRRYGGSFVTKLCSLHDSADGINKKKIEITFHKYFNHYKKFKKS